MSLPVDNAANESPQRSPITILGLFESTLDARRALIALRKADRAPEHISILLQEKDEHHQPNEPSDVVQSIIDHALDAVGNWLVGLAAVRVPRHATLLVAGPLGAALTGAGHVRANDQDDELTVVEQGDDDDDVCETLVLFGFNREEARYIDHRLDAGDAIVAVTTADRAQLQATRRLFADQDAVHIGQARTSDDVTHQVLAILAEPVSPAAGTEVVVADAVAPLRRLCQAPEKEAWVEAMCRAQIVDRDGAEVGAVDDLLADPVQDDDSEDPRKEIRYVVIGFGGLLGLGRHRVAVPAHLVDFETEPARLMLTRNLLQRAPAYDPEEPFSRRDEEAIFAYFGTIPYWAPETGAAMAEGSAV